MIRNRPFSGGPAKATAATLCQKCLQRDNYECRSSTQERPYASRPSRTQQLANPKLMPKLTGDVPNDLLRKKGIADEELAKKEAGRTHDSPPRSRPRSRSSSPSTISTTPSRSPPHHRRQKPAAYGAAAPTARTKRQRSPSSEASSSSAYSYTTASRSHSRSRNARPRSADRHTRRRRSSVSPAPRGRDRRPDAAHPSRTGSVDRSRVARNRRSLTPEADAGAARPTPGERGPGPRGRENEAPAGRARKERSLSPFSRRRALTQAMNMGR